MNIDYFNLQYTPLFHFLQNLDERVKVRKDERGAVGDPKYIIVVRLLYNTVIVGQKKPFLGLYHKGKNDMTRGSV